MIRRRTQPCNELSFAHPGQHKNNARIVPMRDAKYLRAQAALCLQIARQLSDRKAAENLRAEAAQYSAEAEALEQGEPPPMWQARKPDLTRATTPVRPRESGDPVP